MEIPVPPKAGIVDQYVQPACDVINFFDQAFPILVLADIPWKDIRPAARRIDLASQLLQPVFAASSQQGVPPLCREIPRKGFPNPGRSAGDQHSLSNRFWMVHVRESGHLPGAGFVLFGKPPAHGICNRGNHFPGAVTQLAFCLEVAHI